MRTAGQDGARPAVPAEPAVSSGGYRWRWAGEWVRERFWVIPAVLLALGIGLAVLTIEGNGLWHSLGGVPADASWGSGFLESIASATLTFLGVVFTLTLVALQLASSQLSPRVIRTFVRSGITRVAFGTLLAAFAYAVTALVLSHGRSGPAISRAVAVAAVLVAASLVVFLRYVSAMMELLQVVDVIAAVAKETKCAVTASWLPSPASRPAPAPARSEHPDLLRLPASGRFRRRGPGRMLGVDHARLAEVARRHGCVIELTVRMGEFVPAGGVFAAVHAAEGHGPAAPVPAARAPVAARPATLPGPVPAGEAAAAVNLGRGRTLYQDPAFGLRQLADIAAQSLSPAVNQPTTAVLVIDSLEDILLLIARSRRRSGCYTDRDGAVRLMLPLPGWEDCLDLAFTEITVYGATSPQVARRLLAAYAALEAGAAPGLRPAVTARREELSRQLATEGGTQQSLRADSMGLG
ncbi:MAG TPA: DUF2254 domain-containing protein [Trebonia sp.]|jgi:uncharacterized membrane protein